MVIIGTLIISFDYLSAGRYVIIARCDDIIEKIRKTPFKLAFALLEEPQFLEPDEQWTFTVVKKGPDNRLESSLGFDSEFDFLYHYAKKKRKTSHENLSAGERWLSLAHRLNLQENQQHVIKDPESITKARMRAFMFIDRALTNRGNISKVKLQEVAFFLNQIIKSFEPVCLATPKNAKPAQQAAAAKLYLGIIRRILSDPNDSIEGTTLIFESLKSGSLTKKYRQNAVFALQDILQEKGVISDTL